MEDPMGLKHLDKIKLQYYDKLKKKTEKDYVYYDAEKNTLFISPHKE